MIATLEDVAKQSGFSIATVSRVVNGSEGVSSEVRQTVEQAVRELGYVTRRGRAHQALAQAARRERLIEVILHRRSTQENLQAAQQGVAIGPVTSASLDTVLSRGWELSNDFYRTMLDGILHELQVQGGKAIVQVVTDLSDPAVLAGLREDVDGVLVVGEGGPHLPAFLRGCRAPTVLVDIVHPAGGQEVVTTDNLAGIGQAVEHLARLGHRRIGFVAGLDDPTTAERTQAFAYHVGNFGLAVPAEWSAVAYDSIVGTAARLEPLLRRADRPTAVVACSDCGALSVLRAAGVCGLRIPQDLSVVGFDDMRFAALVTPPLTTVRVSAGAIGQLAVRLVLTQGGRERGSVVRLPTQLIVRSSTAAPHGS